MKRFWKIAALMPIMALFLGSCIKPDREKLVIKPNSYSIEIDATQSTPYILEIGANFLWTIECSATWLNFSPSKAMGDRTVEIYASQNTSLEARSTSFFIRGEDVNEEIKVSQKGEAPIITLRENTRTVPATATEIEVELDTNIEIETSSDVSWISRVTTKMMGTDSYYFNIDQNTDLTTRSGHITFKQKNNGAATPQVLTLTQQGEAPDIQLSPSSLTFDVGGGTKGVEVTANIPWSVTVVDETKTWVTITHTESVTTKLMETATRYITVEENKRAEQREAVIVFWRDGEPTLNKFLNITQLAATHIFRCLPESKTVTAAGTSTPSAREIIFIEANFSWVVDQSQTASWITDIEVDEAQTMCTFRVEANTDAQPRTTYLVFKQKEGGTFSKTYQITQAGAEPSIKIDYAVPDILAIPVEPTLIFVTANVTWDYAVDQSWVKVERGKVTSSGVEREYLMCTATANTDSEVRKAYITLTGEGGAKTVVTLTQLAGAALLQVSANTIEAPAQESTTTLTVTANVLWDHSKSVSWIQVSQAPPTKSPLGDSTVLVTVQKNNTLQSRTGTITIKQTNGTLTQTVTVHQEAADPSYTVTPSENKQVIEGTGDDVTLIIDANFPVAYVGTDNSWVEYKSTSADETRFTFTVKPTTLKMYRTAEVSFKNKDGNFTFSYTVVQKGATISRADSLVLIRLYTGLSGPVWRDKWTLSRPVSEWWGVTLSDVITSADPVGKAGELLVTGISLPSNSLLGVLEGGIIIDRIPFEELTYLQHLDLSNNIGLSGRLPENLSKLRYLKELNLSYCTFTNSSSGANIPAEWGGMLDATTRCFSLVTVLKLNQNNLSGTIPSAIRNHINWNEWSALTNILPQRSGVVLTLP